METPFTCTVILNLVPVWAASLDLFPRKLLLEFFTISVNGTTIYTNWKLHKNPEQLLTIHFFPYHIN